jgi:hypothetical protein
MMHSLFSVQNKVGEDTSHWVVPECDSDGESEEELEEVESALRWENSVLVCHPFLLSPQLLIYSTAF